MDIIKFIYWLQEVINMETDALPLPFVLPKFCCWNYDYVDVKLHVKNNCSIAVQVPFNNLWIVVFKGNSFDDLVNELLLKGLNVIEKIHKQYDIADKIIGNKLYSLSDFKKWRYLPKFDLSAGYRRHCEIWCVEITTTIVTSRIGKDNRINTTIEKMYGVNEMGFIINDPYLMQYLPMNKKGILETDYGFIQSGKSIEYKIYLDNQATEKMQDLYNPIIHHEFLNNC